MNGAIKRIRQCECPARDGTAHVAIEVSCGAMVVTVCVGPTEAEYTARSIGEAARAAALKLDQENR